MYMHVRVFYSIPWDLFSDIFRSCTCSRRRYATAAGGDRGGSVRGAAVAGCEEEEVTLVY
jgi:hypothetical protein